MMFSSPVASGSMPSAISVKDEIWPEISKAPFNPQTPDRTRKSVVLPAPLWPMSPNRSPSFSSRLIPASARTITARRWLATSPPSRLNRCSWKEMEFGVVDRERYADVLEADEGHVP